MNKIYKKKTILKNLSEYIDYPDKGLQKVENVLSKGSKSGGEKYKSINTRADNIKYNPKKCRVSSIYEYYEHYSAIKLANRDLVSNILNQQVSTNKTIYEYPQPVNIKKTNGKLTIYDCDVLCNILNESDVIASFSGLKTYELMMVLLRLGFVNNKCFSINTISTFFEMDYTITYNTIKNALSYFKGNISMMNSISRKLIKDEDDN